MVQAAAKSALDFRSADLLSRKWWVKVRWILDRIEDENISSIYKLQHSQHTSVLEYTLTEKAFNHHWDAANTILQDSYSLYFPWLKKDDKQRGKQQEIDALLTQWRNRFGDPKDPRTKEWINKVAKALRQRNVRRRELNAAQPKNPLRDALRRRLATFSKKKGKK